MSTDREELEELVNGMISSKLFRVKADAELWQVEIVQQIKANAKQAITNYANNLLAQYSKQMDGVIGGDEDAKITYKRHDRVDEQTGQNPMITNRNNLRAEQRGAKAKIDKEWGVR